MGSDSNNNRNFVPVMLKDIITNDECARLQQLINDATNIVVCCHVHPDGDAIGSSLGWADYLRHLGKDPKMIIPDMMPDFLQWMPNTEKIIRYDRHQQHADLLIACADLIFCLDMNAASRTDLMAASLQKSKAKRVVIDHHLDADMNAALLVAQPEMSSTCEIVFRLVWQMGAFDMLGRHFAAPVYCGMMTDTGAFTFNSNNPDIFFIICQLLTKGIDKDKIYRQVYHNYSEDRLRLVGYILYRKLEVFPQQKAAFFALSKEEQHRFHFIKGDAEGIVNMPLQMKGLQLSISLREDTEIANCIRVSLRSVDQFPCNKMAECYFNGGGHLNASGGRLACSLEEAVEITRRAILDMNRFL